MGATAPFVGRADELAYFREAFARADADGVLGGAVIAIVGEPGAGKSALAAVATADRRAVWARARDGGGAPPMWMWEQVLRSLGEPIAHTRGASDTGADRFRTFDAVSRQLIGLHLADPVTVVLDDVQWADEESLAFLEFLAPDAEQHGLIVIATVRRGELVELPHHASVIELGGLAPDDVGDLLTPPNGADRVDPDLVDAVWRHTGGNPFFICELDRLLHSAGRESDGAHWRSIVPDGVRSVLMRRFARLPQRAHHTLLAAAELGETIDPEIVAAALGQPVDDVLDDLAAASAASLVHVADDHGLAFGHSLVREAARTELTPGQRRELNRRAAHALGSRTGGAVGQIAQYLLTAGDPEAGAWATRAGDTAYAASMYAEAVTWFERAIERIPADIAPPIRLRYAEAMSRCGRTETAEAEFLALTRVARATNDSELLARSALGVGSIGGGFEVRLLDPTQQSLLAEAIQHLEGTDSAMLATLLARLSIARSLSAGHDERAELAERALAVARRVGDDRATGIALGAWCDAHAGPADIDARSVATAEMLAVAQRCGDVELELLARRLAYVAAFETGDIGLVRRHATAFAGLADRLRLPQFTWYARLVEGTLAHLGGDLDRAAALAAESAELGRSARSANAHMLADGALAPAVARDRGDPDYLDHLIRVNIGIPEANRGIDLAAPFRLYSVGYGGTIEEVAAGLDGWVEMRRSAGPDDGLTLFLGFYLARGAAFVGHSELIAETEAALGPYAERFALDGTGAVCYGPISAALGALAGARGDLDLAHRRYDQAIAACRRLGAPILQALFERELADLGRPATRPDRDGEAHGTFRREGEIWLVGFAGREARLKHSKGLGDLAQLLARPDCDVHVFDLVGADGADRSDSGRVIDATAKAAYERRIRDLSAQIEAAEEAGRDHRAAQLDEERAALITHLAAALGVGGRPRTAASDVERARKAVGMRVREACRRIDAELPDLGRHLRSAVHTGTWCSYRPERPTDWLL